MSHNIYFGFRNRVITLIALIVILFGLGSFFIIFSFKFSDNKKIKYNEKSKLDYKVCLVPNDIYNEACLKSGKTYSSLLIDKISTSFSYEADFSNDFDREFYYHLIVYNSIYDNRDKSKILYENSDLIIDKTPVSKSENVIKIDIDQDINYKKYNDIVSNYKKKYFSDVKANLNVVIYLDDIEKERKIGEIVIPLSEKTFNIKKKSVSGNNLVLNYYSNFDDDGVIYLLIGGILIVLSLIFDIRLVRLVRTTFTKKSKYEIELSKLLREYDKYIVNSKDGYSYDESKDIIKVESLKELVDAANIVSKPIMYSRINNVKSEFIVEDTDKIYKYVLKESQYEE